LVIAVASGALTFSQAWRAGPSLLTGPSSSACPGHFADGQPPALLNPKLATQTVPLCFRAFAVLHSGVTRTPLWSAEHLTQSSLAGAGQTPRRNTFHAEALLARSPRAELSDYTGSGYDRGHMTPSGDMPDA
jgi:endonuclease G